MKKFLHFHLLLGLMVLSQSIVSCGVLDFEFDENVQVAYDMQIEADTIHVMCGESFRLQVQFTPDTVSNQEIFWYTNGDTVVSVLGNDMFALTEGDVYVHAISVQDRIADSCLVRVFPRWEISPHAYPYEMVVNADVKVGGQDLTEDMMVAAYIGNEVRGVGEWKSHRGVKYMQFRIYSHNIDQVSGPGERVRFRLYDRSDHTLRTFPQRIDYSGETHGTLSAPFALHLP